MRLCRCPNPLRSTALLERLRCLRCAGWTPHGRLSPVDHVVASTNEAISLAAQVADDYAWAHSLAYQPTHRTAPGKSSGHGDPTGNVAVDERRLKENGREAAATEEGRPVGRLAIRSYTVVATRLVERALRDLRAADEAIGEALLAAEPPGPPDHTKAPFHDTIPAGRPDLTEAHEARDRRHLRGEGVPS